MGKSPNLEVEEASVLLLANVYGSTGRWKKLEETR